MYFSELRIENFRMFGEGDQKFVVRLNRGLTALVGENDAGKTAIIDAIRFALGTRDQEYMRVSEDDFHVPPDGGEQRKEISIQCKFEDLSIHDLATFAEYLTYELIKENMVPVLYVNWKASRIRNNQRRTLKIESKSGQRGDGPYFDSQSKALLSTTYLKPLRDAAHALTSGRDSRLSQVLQFTKEVCDYGEDYDHDKGAPDDLSTLSILGIGDLTNTLLRDHRGIRDAREKLNNNVLKALSLRGKELEGYISVSGTTKDKKVRFRQLLEKLDLDLRNESSQGHAPNRGLGSNNLLYMACELLLLASDEEGYPLLLIEEPEAHLHPQRQLRIMQFLQRKVNEQRTEGKSIQVIITTHSPNLASVINLENLILIHESRAYPLASSYTNLEKSDYGFLSRFLDVTKANLFFAQGLVIVEGDAENILLPTIARILKRDLTEYGVSIVNVGGIGLRRYARIFQRANTAEGDSFNIPVACVTDFDVMPDCAPSIIGLVKEGEAPGHERRWLVKSDFSTPEKLEQHRNVINDKASGQSVRTFISDEWTLEYDLAYHGLAKEVWIAAQLAKKDEKICFGRATVDQVVEDADKSFAVLTSKELSKEELASYVYSLVRKESKATAAQYLANILDDRFNVGGKDDAAKLLSILPPYITQAIDYVTENNNFSDLRGKEVAEDE